MTSVHRQLRVLVGALFVLALLIAGSVRGAPAQGIIYVRHDAVGNNDGSSWDDAYVDLQAALATGQAGNEIWVAQGVYYPAPTAIDRTATFELVDGVALYGGFAGAENEREERDWEANVTVLSGDLDRNDIVDENGVVTDTVGIVGRNAYHVLRVPYRHTVRMDGFTVTGGLTDGTGKVGGERGGGMRSSSRNLTLVNVTFSGNSAEYGGGLDGRLGALISVTFIGNEAEKGGGLCTSGSPTLTNVTFTVNRAHHGGGMYSIFDDPTLTNINYIGNQAYRGGGMYIRKSDPTLENMTFSNNQAQYGGGMFNSDGEPTLTNITFSGNEALEGGGLYKSGRSMQLTNVSFTSNQATRGGGVYNGERNMRLTDVIFTGNKADRGGGIYNAGNPHLENVTFSNNQAQYGGGMYHSGSFVRMLGVTFSSNEAEQGGGMYSNERAELTNTAFSGNQATQDGGGMYSGNDSTLANALFTGNKADRGGGMYNGGREVTLVNTTFSANQAESSGGAMYNDDSSPLLANSVVWGNDAPAGPQIHNKGTSAPYVMHTNIEGGHSGDNNLDADPLFVDPQPPGAAPTIAGDYRLTEGSPAVDAGTNEVIPEWVDTDLDGLPRIFDGIGDGNAVVDMGAYEFQSPLLTIFKQGQGFVTSTPGPIDCGNLCAAGFLRGTAVTLTAIPDNGWTLDHWSGDCTGTGTCQLTMDDDKSVAATFTQDEYTLEVTIVGEGDVDIYPERDTYLYGDEVMLIATPDPGWTFAAWSGDIENTENPGELMMQENTVITATFTQDNYTLAMNVVGQGVVDIYPQQDTYSYSDEVTLAPAADPGWTFDAWSGPDAGDLSDNGDGTWTLVMDDDKSVTATFAQDQYSLDVTIVGEGDVELEPGQDAYHYADVVTLTATADPGWIFAGWSGDVDSTDNPLELTIEGDTSLTATFTQDQYTLDVDVVGEADVAIDPDQDTYFYGDTVSLTATADAGWTFDGWTGDQVSTDNPLELTIQDDTAITATFTQDEYTLAVTLVGRGDVEVDPDQDTYHYGHVVTLTATADPGWTFVAWSGDIESLDNPLELTIQDDTELMATFTRDEYTLEVAIVGQGDVDIDPEQDTYVYGDVVMLTATADPGWTFAGWSGDVDSTANPLELTIEGDTTITATFEPQEMRVYLPLVLTGR